MINHRDSDISMMLFYHTLAHYSWALRFGGSECRTRLCPPVPVSVPADDASIRLLIPGSKERVNNTMKLLRRWQQLAFDFNDNKFSSEWCQINWFFFRWKCVTFSFFCISLIHSLVCWRLLLALTRLKWKVQVDFYLFLCRDLVELQHFNKVLHFKKTNCSKVNLQSKVVSNGSLQESSLWWKCGFTNDFKNLDRTEINQHCDFWLKNIYRTSRFIQYDDKH